VVWCSRVCACGRDAALLAVTIFMKLRGATAASSAFSSGERCMGGSALNLRESSPTALFLALSVSEVAIHQRISPQHVVPLGAHANALYHSVYIGDAPPLATPSPQKRVHKPTSAPNAGEQGHQPKTLNLTTPHQNINVLNKKKFKIWFGFWCY